MSGLQNNSGEEAASASKHIVEDDDYTSSSGSSSDESDADESQQPSIKITKPPQNQDIQNRLTSFFSQLAEQRANPQKDEIIEEDASDSGFEDDSDGKQYIQLDLALGVLSENSDDEADLKIPKDDSDSSEGEEQMDLDKLKSVNTKTSNKQKKSIEEIG